MPFTVAIEPRPGYLHARITGDNSPETVLGYMAQVRAACERHRCPRVLIEENLTGRGLGTFDVFEVVSKGSREAPAGCFAYVDTNPEHEPRLMKFAETVAVNRGVNMRVFATVAEAEQWISTG